MDKIKRVYGFDAVTSPHISQVFEDWLDFAVETLFYNLEAQMEKYIFCLSAVEMSIYFEV